MVFSSSLENLIKGKYDLVPVSTRAFHQLGECFGIDGHEKKNPGWKQQIQQINDQVTFTTWISSPLNSVISPDTDLERFPSASENSNMMVPVMNLSPPPALQNVVNAASETLTRAPTS